MIAQILTPKASETVADPCCGSGRMLLSALKAERDITVFGCDIDSRCVAMTTINLFLHGAKGYTFHMNSLSQEIRGGYHFGVKFGLPYLQELSVDKCKSILIPPKLEQLKSGLNSEQKNILLEQSKEINTTGEQLKLF